MTRSSCCLVELALKAPTGSNARSWEFVVVATPPKLARRGTFEPGVPGASTAGSDGVSIAATRR